MGIPIVIDLDDPISVERAFEAGAEANRGASCRRASIDFIEAPGRLIATGDLHDNPVHLAALIDAASKAGAHLTLHEIIHSDRLVAGMDLSYRALARVSALKAADPERIHTLLANHELAQIVGAGIIKDGIRVVEAFNAGLEYAFGDEAPGVAEAIDRFVRSMPLALRCRTPQGDILCAHSVPGPAMMGRFDAGVLDRDLVDADYAPRTGAAHIMVWGRGYDADLLEDLVERWGVSMFILGHEKAESGVQFIPPCAIILNSDHPRGVYLPIDLSDPPTPQDAPAQVVALSRGAQG